MADRPQAASARQSGAAGLLLRALQGGTPACHATEEASMQPDPITSPAPQVHRRIWGFPQPVFEAACIVACEGKTPGPTTIDPAPCHITVRPLQERAASWLASTPVPRAASADRSLWHNTLLCANTALMRHGSYAFGLDEEERPLLTAQLFTSPDDPIGLARQLQRMHELWQCAKVLAAADATTIAHAHVEAFMLPQLAHPTVSDAKRESLISNTLIESLLAMGVSSQQACQISAAGKLRLDKAEISFECPPTGIALLMVITLRDALLDGTAASALQLTTELMADFGIAVGRTSTGYQLLARWPCNGQAKTEFGKFVATFAELPTVLLADTTVYDPGDSDLDVLLPHV